MEAGCTQGAKKVIFTACHSGKLKLTFTSPNIISTSPQNVLMSRLISQFFRNLNSSKNYTCLSGKQRIQFNSSIAHYFLCMLLQYKTTKPGKTLPFVQLQHTTMTLPHQKNTFISKWHLIQPLQREKYTKSQCLSPRAIRRQGGRVVTALDLQSGSPRLKSHSDHLLVLGPPKFKVA